MRVLQISHGIYPATQAGTEIYTAELAASLVKSGVDLTVAVPGTPAVYAAAAAGRLGEYVSPLAMSPQSRFGNKLRYARLKGPLWQDELRLLISQSRPELIHIQHAVGFGVSALELVAQTGLPIILTLPDYWLLCPGILNRCRGSLSACARECCAEERIGKLPLPIRRLYVASRRRKIERFIRRTRPLMAAISDDTRKEHERQGFPRELMVTHEWGIDVERLRSSAAGKRGRNSAPRVGYIGSMRSHKGCHVLARSFRKVTYPASLHFYGSGDDDYIRSLREECTGSEIHFHGRFDHANVGHILGEIDVVVIPSVWEETYCLVAQEAMAARKPVIATRVGGLAGRITHGVNGFLVPPNNVEALARELSSVLASLDTLPTRLDHDRCLIDLSDDTQGWIDLYERAIGEHRKALHV